jgi:hypothetical protein
VPFPSLSPPFQTADALRFIFSSCVFGFRIEFKKKAILKYRYRRNEIVEAAKKSGVPVEYVVFDNEGHGFTKKANEIRANKAILDFLDKHLRGK